MSIFKDFYSIFFPKSCLICQSHLKLQENLICLNCEHHLPFTDFTEFENNSFEMSLRGRIPIHEATSLLYFRKNGITQKLIHQLKYQGFQEIGTFFGQLLGDKILISNRFKTIDGIILVPLHPKKLKKRGYNQLTLFADELAKKLNVPIFEHVLVKIDQTISQTTKTRWNRFDKLYEKFHGENLNSIEGKHILLIDDVFTTGATLESCANEILKAKNAKISLATMAFPGF